MTDNLGMGKLAFQLGDQFIQCEPLGRGVIVIGGFAIVGQTTNQADTDTSLIETYSVGTNGIKFSSVFNGAIPSNHEMVANTEPTLRPVPSVDFFCADIHLCRGCRAVDNDKICTFSHN